MKWQQISALIIGLVTTGFIIMGTLHMKEESRSRPVRRSDDDDGILGANILATLILILTILAVFQ
jgi:hypothetical protein